jgi:phosphatidylglycerophosphate synthase
VSPRTPKPSVADVRAKAQPASIFARNSGEHWAGRLYMRGVSPRLTRLVIPTRITPNAMTWLMLLAGVGAGAALTIDGIAGPLLAVALIQLQLLLDCADGELARWRGLQSPVGIYLDRAAHWTTETALPIGLGIRVDRPVLGLVAAVLQLLVKGESALVHVARLEAGLPRAPDTAAIAAPRPGLLARARRVAGHLPFYRAFVAVEFTLLTLAAAAAGVDRDWLIALVPVGAITLLGHGVAILTGGRLR